MKNSNFLFEVLSNQTFKKLTVFMENLGFCKKSNDIEAFVSLNYLLKFVK